MQSNRVCIIGAGAAGIAGAAALSRAGVPFDWFEAGCQPGGLWCYGNDTGVSVYASLMTNTSFRRMEWFGHALPADRKNDYLAHPEVLDYLTSFLRDANLADRITLSTRVTRVEALGSNHFRVAVESSGDSSESDYRAVIVANGRHAKAKRPNIPGVAGISSMHACDYRTPEIFSGKNVVVLGFGASGVDIASDAADVAQSVVLSTRTGGYLVAKYAGDRPRDEKERAWLSRLPLGVRRQLWRLVNVQRPISPNGVASRKRGLKPFEKPAVLSDRFAQLIETGRVAIKPALKHVEGRTAVFEDGSRIACDVLVFATGYETSFPFLSADSTPTDATFVDRYLRVVPPNQPDLYFIGQVSVAGPLFPIFERQALWVADLIKGRCLLPDPDRLRQLAARQSELGRTRFPGATQPYDCVEYYSYVRALEREHRAGRFRRLAARRSGSGPLGDSVPLHARISFRDAEQSGADQ